MKKKKKLMESKTKDLFVDINDLDLDDTNYTSNNSGNIISTDESSKMKNRIAAKKCREKKNEFLNRLEMENDYLAHEVLKLSFQAIAIKSENKVLEENIAFFQSFLYTIMKKNK